jgi:steroid delta-isomerase-like uncharacterized protein
MQDFEKTIAEHKAFAYRFYELWNAGEMDAMYDMLDEQVHDRNAGAGESGRAGVRKVLDHIRAAMPNLTYTVRDVVSNGTDTFVVFLRPRGTQTGELFGCPPKGQTAEWNEVRLCRLRDGKVIEHSAVIDGLAMYTQLGHVTPPERGSW